MGPSRAGSVRLLRYLPLVFVATSAVVVVPAVAAHWLREEGLVESLPVLLVFTVMLSVAISLGGRVAWQRWRGSADYLFGDLLLWGWLRRCWIERRLANSVSLLGLSDARHPRRPLPADGARRVKALERLATALEAGDPYTHGHSRRVARHATAIAKRLGLPGAEVTRIRTAAALHDVGKIDTPKGILHKASRLSDEEFEVIKRHPVRGAEMVQSLADPELVGIVRHHHERLDGNGYPSGLCGEGIPLGARIIAVADTFDAMTSSRPYRSARPHKVVLETLRREAGTQLDSRVVQAFCAYYSGFRSLVLWSSLTSLPQRLLYPLFGDLSSSGGALSAAKVMTAAAVTAAAGGAALEAASPGQTSRPTVAAVAAAIRPASGEIKDTAGSTPTGETRGEDRSGRKRESRKPRGKADSERGAKAGAAGPGTGTSSESAPAGNAPSQGAGGNPGTTNGGGEGGTSGGGGGTTGGGGGGGATTGSGLPLPGTGTAVEPPPLPPVEPELPDPPDLPVEPPPLPDLPVKPDLPDAPL
jgi:putative nucleotidyltransferase with HDIG domain